MTSSTTSSPTDPPSANPCTAATTASPSEADLFALQAMADTLRADYQERYGAVVFEVRVERNDAGLVLRGRVLLPAQRSRVLDLLARASNLPCTCELTVLADESTPPLAWAQPRGGVVSLFAQPLEGDAAPQAIHSCEAAEAMRLATQLVPGDPPLRVLEVRGSWNLVQCADATLGWAHACELFHVEPSPRDPWGERARVLEGQTLPSAHTAESLRTAAEALASVPYILGGNHPQQGLDCSALVQRVYQEALGVTLPKHTGDQRRCGVRVARHDIEAGDLLFFKSRERGFSHVGLALQEAGAQVMHASRSHGKVVVQSLDDMRASYAYLGARRVVRFRRAPHLQAPPSEGAPAELPSIHLSEPATWIHRNVHVVGVAGAEGAALMRFLLDLGVHRVTGHDFSTPDSFEKSFRLSHLGLRSKERAAQLRQLTQGRGTLRLRDEYLQGIESAELIFVPQGWFLYESNAPLHALRQRSDVVFSQMTDLYFRLAPCPVLAVTGTNGKSTTTRLLADIMAASEHPLLFAGNDRRNVQVLDVLQSASPDARLVLEVSNRQLLDIHPRPHIAVITVITPDHIEEHGSFDDYVAVKRKLIESQTAKDVAILNRDHPLTWEQRHHTAARVLPFAVDTKPEGDGAWLVDGRLELHLEGSAEVLCLASQLKVPGRHNIANVLAASLAGRLGGVPLDVIRAVVPTFEGIGLRLQHIATIRGVRYINDLKATTPDASCVAVQAFDAPLHVIVGGGDKGLDFTRLAGLLAQRARHLVVLDSAGGHRLASAVQRAAHGQGIAGPKLSVHPNLARAVGAAQAEAQPGDVVMLSPACPGLFSMFIDESAGFGALVAQLATQGDTASNSTAAQAT